MSFSSAQPEDLLFDAARRGDLAWWPGHIGILLAPERLLHANAYWMRCMEEPLANVEARVGALARFFRL